jgi:hypothetical protein
MSRDLQEFLPDDSAIYGSVALHACWNMQKEQIPVPPVVMFLQFLLLGVRHMWDVAFFKLLHGF